MIADLMDKKKLRWIIFLKSYTNHNHFKDWVSRFNWVLQRDKRTNWYCKHVFLFFYVVNAVFNKYCI